DRAGTDAPNAMLDNSDAIHIGQPATKKKARSKAVPSRSVVAPTSRRPLASATRPPSTTPIVPGEPVTIDSRAIRPPEKCRSTRRKRLLNSEAGAMKTLKGKPEA